MTDKPFDPTKPIRTRDGRAARIICTDRKGQYPIISCVEHADGTEALLAVMRDGSSAAFGDPRPSDLVNIPEQEVRWVYVYSDSCISSAFSSRQKADFCVGRGYIGVMKLVFEDGKLVSHEYEAVP